MSFLKKVTSTAKTRRRKKHYVTIVNCSMTRRKAARSLNWCIAATGRWTTRAKTNVARVPTASIPTSKRAVPSSISVKIQRKSKAASVHRASSLTCSHCAATGRLMCPCRAAPSQPPRLPFHQQCSWTFFSYSLQSILLFVRTCIFKHVSLLFF